MSRDGSGADGGSNDHDIEDDLGGYDIGDGRGNYDIKDVFEQLEVLEETVTSPEERQEIEHTRRMLAHLPRSNRIRKYTTRDVSEGIVGGIVFSLPFLVEGGVFDIAEWFVTIRVGPVPVFFLLNAAFIVVLAAKVLYVTDIRTVHITYPIFGVIPRRLVGVLASSFLVAAALMFAWGRLHEGEPTVLEQFARVTVTWTAASLGAVLADILPGESRGTDISEMLDFGDGPNG